MKWLLDVSIYSVSNASSNKYAEFQTYTFLHRIWFALFLLIFYVPEAIDKCHFNWKNKKPENFMKKKYKLFRELVITIKSAVWYKSGYLIGHQHLWIAIITPVSIQIHHSNHRLLNRKNLDTFGYLSNYLCFV